MIQDDLGFVWIGTQDGLARYDGYDFTIFRHQKGNPNSLSHNFIWDMTKDEEGLIWITTLGNGLTRLDPAKMEFTQFLHNENQGEGLSHWNTFSTLRSDSLLYVGTNESLDCIHLNSGSISTYVPGAEWGPDSVTSLIRSMAKFSDQRMIWLSTSLGLAQFDPLFEKFRYYRKSPFGTNTNLRNIFTLAVEEGALLVVTTQRVLKIDFGNETEQILFDIKDFALPISARFHGLLRGQHGADYLYTSHGLIRIDHYSGFRMHQVHDPGNSESLTHNYVIDVIETSDGALWIGTRNGLTTSRHFDARFLRVGLSDIPGQSLEGKGVNALSSFNDSMLLAGTFSGLELVHLKSGNCTLIEPYRSGKLPEPSHYILSILRDGNNSFWAGSRNGGLTHLEFSTSGKIATKHYPLQGASIQYIHNADSILWLGSSGGGLMKFSKENALLTSYPSTGDSLGPAHPFIYTIHVDHCDNFWIGTPTGGLNLFDPSTGHFLHLLASNRSAGISGNFILCTFEDSKGNLWVGTTTGLSKLLTPIAPNLFKKIQDGQVGLRFQHYGREVGFPNEVIYGMVEDSSGHFWVSTNEGLALFDPNLEQVIKVYGREEGCQSGEHNQNAYVLLSDGSMAFGGPYGLYHFHPNQLNDQKFAPKVTLVNVEVDKEPLNPLQSGLDLPFGKNDLTFQFASLCYVNTHKTRYKYRLAGFDQTWYERSTNRVVNYTNLDPGNYTFEVHAANSSGVWTPSPVSFHFSIGKPIWRTWYAYTAYALLLLACISAFTKWRTNRVRREAQRRLEIEAVRAEERELFRKRSARDFHDEAGNKITRINLLVELAKNRNTGDDTLNDYLQKIAGNAKELARGMRDFNWTLDPEKDALFDLVERIKGFGDSMLEGKEGNFSVKGLDEELLKYKLSMGMRRDVMMIFKEAINNAVKHSYSNHFTFEINIAEGAITLSLCDHGRGINTDAKSDGYGLKNMKARAQKHGLSLSIDCHNHKGTCVSLKLPHMGGSPDARKL